MCDDSSTKAERPFLQRQMEGPVRGRLRGRADCAGSLVGCWYGGPGLVLSLIYLLIKIADLSSRFGKVHLPAGRSYKLARETLTKETVQLL